MWCVVRVVFGLFVFHKFPSFIHPPPPNTDNQIAATSSLSVLENDKSRADFELNWSRDFRTRTEKGCLRGPGRMPLVWGGLSKIFREIPSVFIYIFPFYFHQIATPLTVSLSSAASASLNLLSRGLDRGGRLGIIVYVGKEGKQKGVKLGLHFGSKKN